ncbi:hypothetical protein BpHYR1_015012 [Brachionus plicatilis]|uniref:Uncharacterized protein n=1 Tax=Brachionus plicatilis TaxID=10195 RepID=A0A3M7T4B4_BRAPC|nr:hypothetical protein BpHYR1_015012 [Brachionus plicatilis]
MSNKFDARRGRTARHDKKKKMLLSVDSQTNKINLQKKNPTKHTNKQHKSLKSINKLDLSVQFAVKYLNLDNESARPSMQRTNKITINKIQLYTIFK